MINRKFIAIAAGSTLLGAVAAAAEQHDAYAIVDDLDPDDKAPTGIAKVRETHQPSTAISPEIETRQIRRARERIAAKGGINK